MAELQWLHAWVKNFNTPIPLTTAPLSSTFQRLQGKRQSLVEKLLPRSSFLVPRDAEPPPVEDKGKEGSLTFYKPTTVTQQHSNSTKEVSVGTVCEIPHSTIEEHTTSGSVSTELSILAAGERLFVFRDPPLSGDCEEAPKRKKKKNFLNRKKSSVAPTDQPWNLRNFILVQGLLFVWSPD